MCKRNHFILFLIFSCIWAYPAFAQQDDTPRPFLIWGRMEYDDKSIPQSVSITITNTGTSERVSLDGRMSMYDPGSGYYKMQAGNLPSGFSLGDIIMIDIVDLSSEESVSVPISVTSAASLEVETVVLKKSATSRSSTTTLKQTTTTEQSAVTTTTSVAIDPAVPVTTTKTQRDTGRVCAQVITPAVSPTGVCVEFPTPCEVPLNWKKVATCPKSTRPSGGDTSSDTGPASTKASCSDGVKNQQEFGVDCGGPCGACLKDSSSDSGYIWLLGGIAFVLVVLVVLAFSGIIVIKKKGKEDS